MTRHCAAWLLLIILMIIPAQGIGASRDITPPVDEVWADEFGLPSADGFFTCAVRFGDDIIVGGSFQQIGGIQVNNIARWDGSLWHPLGEGVDRGVRCLAVYNGRLYAGGWLSCTDGQSSPWLAEWDGVAWSSIAVSDDCG